MTTEEPSRSSFTPTLGRNQGLVTSEMVPAQLALNDNNRHGGTRLANHRY